MLAPDFGRSGFDPFREMRRMQSEMNRMFSGSAAAGQEFPPMNLWFGDNSLVVTAEIPGVAPQDVDITVHQNLLTLTTRSQPESLDEKNVVWHRRERRYGASSRTVQLPFRVDPDRVQARCRDGVIEIELRRPEEDRPRKIQVQAR